MHLDPNAAEIAGRQHAWAMSSLACPHQDLVYDNSLMCPLTAVNEEERDVIDVTTTAGYEQIVAVWEARGDVDSVMGRKAWKTLFPAMIKGRLKTTPWLNKVYALKCRLLFFPLS